MSIKDLFSPITVGDLTLKNRIVMAPMTRNRAAADGVPQAMNVEYYRQRSTAGLIISEASQISAEAVGYPATPGIHSDEQIAGWQSITNAVHEQGSKMYLQLWYCGRISHPDLLPENQIPVAPSAIKPEGEAITLEGMKAFVEPRALEVRDIQDIVSQYRSAAKNAKQAGFDGVEIHAANGYLIDQFLRDGSNTRTDGYGGSKENRMRLLNEVIDAVCEIWNNQRVGVRLTPENSFNSMSDSNPQSHFDYFIKQLNVRKLAYIHLLEGDMMGADSAVDYRALRDVYDGIYMANNGYDKNRGQASIQQGNSDLVAFGIPFIANPDLVLRYKNDLSLNEADQNTFYGGDETGYTNYAFSKKEAAEAV